tara:strand:+ start:9302 stop:9685 length:384 start_codon:yes stop_codon:yes gene_type:complete
MAESDVDPAACLSTGPKVVRAAEGVGALNGTEVIEFVVDGVPLITTPEYIAHPDVSTRAIKDAIRRALPSGTEKLTALPPIIRKRRANYQQVRSRSATKHGGPDRLGAIERQLKTILARLDELASRT